MATKTDDKSLDSKPKEAEEDIYNSLKGGLGSTATHKHMSFNMSLGASMDLGDSFACVDDDDDLDLLSADAAQFQKLESEKSKQALRSASRQPDLELIGEDEEEEDEEEN
mmetsp:Transcript_4215/g.8551  ORF Transcript_4215/g.8551 Transcript_4215/m.8551 type:complete len:110 (-) Transcript_4215:254-583(-)